MLLAVVVLEIAYLYLRTQITTSASFYDLSMIGQEVARSVLRGASLGAVLAACWIFKSPPEFFRKPEFNPTVIVLLILLILEVLAAPKSHVTGLSVQLTYAAATIFVAVREELVYRYVLQNWLQATLSTRLQVGGSILITSLIFTLFHIGAQPIESFGWIFLSSILMGAVYIFSGKNLGLVIAAHFIYDLLYI